LCELRKEKRKVTPKIIFEDDSLMVIEKPAGLTVNRAETTKGEETLQDWVEKEIFRHLDLKKFRSDSDFLKRSGIVHRLDKETSGLLLIAKTPQVFENLQKQFKERKVKKTYLALVHGQVEPREGVIEASIARSPFDRKKFGVFLGGREAKTSYRVLEYLSPVKLFPPKIPIKGTLFGGPPELATQKEFTLLELTPETGRTHQIRVHLKFIGHSIVGDEKYAGRKTARDDRKWCPRQFLHAADLFFDHPVTGQRMELSSKLPSDLQLAMMKLE